jgi:hypothetical protein
MSRETGNEFFAEGGVAGWRLAFGVWRFNIRAGREYYSE